MRVIVTLTAAAVVLLISVASAQDPAPTPTPTVTPAPTETPSPTPVPGDTIITAVEPPGTNCPNGGVKITTIHPPPAEPDVVFVCNGDPGQAGDPGDPGQAGDPGQDGQDGSNGSDGSDGFDGRDATPPTSSSARRSCGKASKTVRLRLPARFRRARTVTLTVAGDRNSVPVTRRAITVNLKGLPCGSYPVVVQRRGIRPFVRIFTLHPGGRVTREPVGG